MRELEQAWAWREEKGLLKDPTGALRVFHGPGESPSGALSHIAIDRFGDCYWITEWEGRQKAAHSRDQVRNEIQDFLRSHKARAAVALWRPERGVPTPPEAILGEPPEQHQATELGLKYWIKLKDSRHPGLFLDHAPLRAWLIENTRGLSVLNTFSYTGSLSVACGRGGAKHVTTLDLSKATVSWAKENWLLNQFPESDGDWIYGDYFEWLPKFKRQEKKFDCVILDPPSFSRSKNGTFSTSKDLVKLHQLALEVLVPGGLLITSINSANVTREQYQLEVEKAAKAAGRKLKPLHSIELPETFKTRSATDQYLKGWILRA